MLKKLVKKVLPFCKPIKDLKINETAAIFPKYLIYCIENQSFWIDETMQLCLKKMEKGAELITKTATGYKLQVNTTRDGLNSIVILGEESISPIFFSPVTIELLESEEKRLDYLTQLATEVADKNHFLEAIRLSKVINRLQQKVNAALVALLIFFSTATVAQPTLSINQTDLGDGKAPIFLKNKMVVHLNTPAYIVNPYHMEYLLSIHRFTQDSMPDMEMIAEGYAWVLEQKDKDYKELLKNTKERDASTLKTLNVANDLGWTIQQTMKDSQMRLNAALEKTLELQKTYRKRERKSKVKRFLNGLGILSTGVLTGIIITKI